MARPDTSPTLEQLQRETSELRRRIAQLEQEAAVRVSAESEGRYQSLADLSPDAILIHSGGKYVYANPAAARLFGAHSPGELIGKDVLGLVHPDHRQAAAERIGQAYSGSVMPLWELKFIRFDGSFVDAEISGAKVEFGGGPAIQLIARDITERGRAEAKLRELSQRLTYHVDNSPLAVIEWGADMRLTRWSGAAERVFGWTADEVLGKRMGEFRWVFEADVVQVTEVSAELETGANRHSFSANRNYRKDGSVVHCEWYNSSLLDESGKLRSILSLVLDVTERKQAEAAQRQSDERMRAVLSALPVGVAVMDASGFTVFANKMMQRIWGGTNSVPVFASSIADTARFKAWWVADGRPVAPADWGSARALNCGETCVGDMIDIERFDGTRGTIMNNATPLRDAQGDVNGALVAVLDVTELRRAQKALKEADRRKDEFLAMLAHELRNPLAAISSAIQFLRMRGPEDPRLRSARDIAERQANHMARLLDDLLDVSRVTQGKVTLKTEELALASVIESAMETVRPLIEAKGHRLFVSLARDPLLLNADHVRLTQVISNLLNNAAKYTPAGGELHLSAEREGCEAVIRVRDNGAGIAPELLPHVFDLFVQADRSPDRVQGGLGIGLTLVRVLVEMHGGRVEARSEGLGKGSEFVLWLPLCPSPAQARMPESREAEGVVPRRILVVDDNADSAEMMAALLEIEGHQVATALSGQDALDLAARSVPEVALVDIGMPGMSGFELARRMKREPSLAATILVAVTGYGQEEDLQKSREAGFDHHLVKPVTVEALKRILQRL